MDWQSSTPTQKVRLEITHDYSLDALCHKPSVPIPIYTFPVSTNFPLLVAYLFIVFPGFALIALADLAVTPLS